MTTKRPAAWDIATDENLPFRNSARATKARATKQTASKVDCGASVGSVRRGLSENGVAKGAAGAGASGQPVGRTMVMATTTIATKAMAAAMPDDDCTDYYETAMTCMPDVNDEWRKVLNTKCSGPYFGDNKKKIDQQTRLVGDLKQCIDTGRQQREVFFERVKVVQQTLQSELSQLAEVQNACARADGLREQIGVLEERLGSVEGETAEAVAKANTLNAELQEVNTKLQAVEQALEENTAVLAEAKSAQTTALEDAKSDVAQLKEDVSTAITTIATLKKSIVDLKAQIKKLEKDSAAALSAHEKEQEIFEQKMADGKKERKEMAEATAEAETEVAKLQSLQDTKEVVLGTEQATLSECRSTMELHKSSADTTEEEMMGQEKDCQRLREEVSSLKKKQTSLTEETGTLRAQKDQLQSQNRKLVTVSWQLKEQCDTLSNEETKLAGLNRKLESGIAENQAKTKQSNAASAAALQTYTKESSATAILSKQLAGLESEQAAGEAQKAAQTAKRDQLIVDNANLTKEHEAFVVDKPALLEKITQQEAELAELKEKYGAKSKKQVEDLCAKQAEANALQVKYNELEDSVGAKRDMIQGVRDLIVSQQAQIEANEKAAIANEGMRRKLHNTMTELKGNIRVFCRVRPIKDSERLEGQLVDTVGTPAETGDNDKEVIQLSAPGVQADMAGNVKDDLMHSFGFDKVFPMKSSQEQVFEEVSTMVQSALDGYKVCIFAYGQTGSGKTHTMQGGEVANTEGIIPRSIIHILNEARRLKAQGWEYTMTANFLEIYNEDVRDLLREGAQKKKGGKKEAWGEDSGPDIKYTIKHDDMGNTTVSNMTSVSISSLSDVEDLMAKAERQRSVSATAMNSRSSRSHSVFTLRLSGRNESQGTALSGVLNLIDLAGSERLKSSEATGSRLKETQAINKSLSSLASVFVALGNKDKHIPYRNSKLTYLLQVRSRHLPANHRNHAFRFVSFRLTALYLC